MTKNNIDDFITTIARLRGPDGCPWDREQTHKSLGRYLLEESYEVLEAIHADDAKMLKEELGDLLLQIVLNAQIAKDNEEFDIYDVADSINKKMIHRHPHVFGNKKIDKADQVVAQWETIKDKEHKGNSSGIDRVPKALPALLMALKVSEKAVSQGFEWKKEEDVWDKLDSEMVELKQAIKDAEGSDSQKAKEEVELELGDVLFCMVNVARWNKLNPEEALIKAIEKFKERFRTMEQISDEPLETLTKDDLAQLWAKSKNHLASSRD